MSASKQGGSDKAFAARMSQFEGVQGKTWQLPT